MGSWRTVTAVIPCAWRSADERVLIWWPLHPTVPTDPGRSSKGRAVQGGVWQRSPAIPTYSSAGVVAGIGYPIHDLGVVGSVPHLLCHTHDPGLGNGLGSQIKKRWPQSRTLHCSPLAPAIAFSQILAPPQSLHLFLWRLCSWMLVLPRSLQLLPWRLCSLMLVPPQSLRSLLTRLWAPSPLV